MPPRSNLWPAASLRLRRFAEAADEPLPDQRMEEVECHRPRFEGDSERLFTILSMRRFFQYGTRSAFACQLEKRASASARMICTAGIVRWGGGTLSSWR